MSPNILSIAGFDPSAGAGVIADAKTAEAQGAYCLCVATAITYQNDSQFDGVDWIDTRDVIRQVEVLQRRLPVAAVKIGLVRDVRSLRAIVTHLRGTLGSVPIVWDPILNASAGFEFHGEDMASGSPGILEHVSLVTPNIPECERLFGTSAPADLREVLHAGQQASILLKGGHSEGNDSTDFLVEPTGVSPIHGVKFPGFQKHGTGCILSAAIASHLALGRNMVEACTLGKRYVERIITSNTSLLASHYK